MVHSSISTPPYVMTLSDGKKFQRRKRLTIFETLEGLVILEVTGVGDLSWSPLSLVFGVIGHRSKPLVVESGVNLQWLVPLTTPRSIRNGWGDPVTILLIIPLFRLFGFGIRGIQRFVVDPPLRLGVALDPLSWPSC